MDMVNLDAQLVMVMEGFQLLIGIHTMATIPLRFHVLLAAA